MQLSQQVFSVNIARLLYLSLTQSSYHMIVVQHHIFYYFLQDYLLVHIQFQALPPQQVR